jgi:hypothetical protein
LITRASDDHFWTCGEVVCLFYSYYIHSDKSMTEPKSPPPPGEQVKVAEMWRGGCGYDPGDSIPKPRNSIFLPLPLFTLNKIITRRFL